MERSVSESFFDYVNSLNLPIIDYFAIGVQDTIHNTSTSIMSRPEWQKTFSALNLAKHDPVRIASFNTNAKYFAFDELDHQNEFGKEVMRQRRRHQIENGIVLMNRYLGHNFILTLATGYRNFRPYKFLIHNHLEIANIFHDLINLVRPSTENYQYKIPNHQHGDAK